MIKPRSYQKSYDDCYSRDPAFSALPIEATPAEIQERARLVRVAREQNDWSALLLEGQTPTRFTFKPLRGEVYRKLIDWASNNTIGSGRLGQLCFLCALVDITNFGDHKVSRTHHEVLGEMATVETSDALDAIDMRIVNELGGEILNRAREVNPK